MSYWPFWGVGLALAAIPLLHWLLLRRMFAVSGRYTALVDRARAGAPASQELSQEEMLAAMRAATEEAFGADCVGAPAPQSPEAPAPRAQSAGTHGLFLVAIAAGAAVSSWLAGGASTWGHTGQGAAFTRIFGARPLVGAGVLLAGGLLVGFGTRMASGCTSGHGLCGVSRLQKGSLVATAMFFGAGIAVSLLLGR